MLQRQRQRQDGIRQSLTHFTILFIGPRCPWSDLWVLVSVCPSVQEVCKDLTDVTLADEDTNSILTDNANRAIQGNVAMQ